MSKKNKNIQNRIDELRKVIEEHNINYYVLNSPIISDFEYDILINELETLEKAYPQFYSQDSPTNKVGSDLSNVSNYVDMPDESKDEFVKFPHKYQMFSLSNTYDKGELSAFIQKITLSQKTQVKFSAELKFDGTAISLTYKNGKLFRALTRGDGNVGEDVTDNVKRIDSLPINLIGSDFPDEFEVRGEIYMPWIVFENINSERQDSGDNLFANPRNAAAGSLKLLNSDKVAARGLECVLYQFISDKKISNSHFETIQIIKSWGLPVSNHSRLCNTLEEVIDYIDYWDEERKKLPYATDGAVIKVDNLDIQASLGTTAKSPRWATAYKFKAERVLTKLLSVDFQVGRTGAITPVANLYPVLLSGSVVKRASLHNADQISLLDIRYNDSVFIEKGGEIIPKIISVDLSAREKNSVPVIFPEYCPDCGTKLIKEDNESKHYCPNSENCPTQIKAAFIHFCSRKAMNILAGEATINQLYSADLIRHLFDIYNIKNEDLLKLPGWKSQSVKRFLLSVSESKSIPFYKVLFALGIRYVGETTAKNLAYHFKDIDSIIGASFDELSEVEEVGQIIADSVLKYFLSPEKLLLIENLKKIGLKFSMEEKLSNFKSNNLQGKTIVISGNFSISRESLKDLIESNAGKVGSSITSGTSFLVAGESPGPVKLKKAESLGIKVISENELIQIIDNKYNNYNETN